MHLHVLAMGSYDTLITMQRLNSFVDFPVCALSIFAGSFGRS